MTLSAKWAHLAPLSRTPSLSSMWSRTPASPAGPAAPPAGAAGGKPLPLVSTGPDGRFVLGTDALAVLRSISGPVAVAAVCGRARQGKSYVLNALARTAGGALAPGGASGAGFVVAATHKPCTKGLWLWSSPIPRTAPDGTRFVSRHTFLWREFV